MPLLAEVRSNSTDYNKYMIASPIVASALWCKSQLPGGRHQSLHVAGLWELWRHLEHSVQPRHTKSVDISEASSLVSTAVQHC